MSIVCNCVSVPRCKTRLDVGFIVDASGSLRLEYHKEKAFIKELVDSLGVGLSSTRVGVVTFSHIADLSIRLSQFNSKEDLKKAIDALPMIGATTRIDKALKVVVDQLFTKANGAR